jgi:hypothetical protein
MSTPGKPLISTPAELSSLKRVAGKTAQACFDSIPSENLNCLQGAVACIYASISLLGKSDAFAYAKGAQEQANKAESLKEAIKVLRSVLDNTGVEILAQQAKAHAKCIEIPET